MRTHTILVAGAFLLGLIGLAGGAVLYVDADSTNPAPRYTTWATAAVTIQDAIDASSAGDQIVVTNGVYRTGGRPIYGPQTNRVAINKAVTVRSVNGAIATRIEGNWVFDSTAVRCAYLTNGAALIGFTLTNGATMNSGTNRLREECGGGVWCESGDALVASCTIVSNRAYSQGAGTCSGTISNCTVSFNWFGGGAYLSTLLGCTISSNVASGVSSCTLSNCSLIGNSGGSGGGAWSSTLVNCRLIGNTATYGGGADSSILTNCLIASNSSVQDGGGVADSSFVVNCTLVNNRSLIPGTGAAGGSCALENCIAYYNLPAGGDYPGAMANYCCLTPLPTNGVGNFTNAPLFVDASSDFHLLPNSPCINSGNNAYLSSGSDLDGNPRVLGGTIDIGAYEYQAPTSIISYQWLQQYGLATDGSADFVDPDGDGMNNWKEWICGTDPTNALSVLRMNRAAPGLGGVLVSWQGVGNRNYSLERSTNLGLRPAFFSIATNIAGQNGITTYSDTNAPKAAFYRVGVQR